MSELPDPKADCQPDPAQRAKDGTKARLAAALKANMARRKAQSRARSGTQATDAPTKTEE